MEQYALYLALKSIIVGLGGNYKYSFNDMDLNGKNVAGIFIKGAEPSEYRAVASGKYYNYSSRVQILIQGDNNNSSLMDMLGHISKVRETLIVASNGIYNTTPQIKWIDGEIQYNSDGTLQGDDVYVRLNKVDLLGEVDFKGKTGQGLPKYSLNLKVYYSIQGGN